MKTEPKVNNVACKHYRDKMGAKRLTNTVLADNNNETQEQKEG
jgi:hypothetical protein